MKELSIEEKAQRYDEAIEGIQEILSSGEDYIKMSRLQLRLHGLFPELKESEDERIRKELIDFVKSRLAGFPQCEKFISWLEKQGEHKRFRDFIQVGDKVTRNESGELVNISQLERIAKPRRAKPTDKIKPKFKVGDSIKTTNEAPLTITKITDSGYWSEDLFICSFGNADKWELVEQKLNNKVEPKFHKGEWITDGNITIQIEAIKNDCYLYCGDCTLYSTKIADKVYHLWTIEDAKDGDVLCSEQIILLFKKWEDNTDYNFVIAHAGIDVSGKLQITNEHWLISNKSKPATKEQRDTLFAKIVEAGYEWDADKKELKRIVITNLVKDCITQKPAEWSEEDESILQGIWDEILTNKHNAKEYEWKTYDKFLDWLKSLKNRVQPKVEWNEEDEDMLYKTISVINRLCAEGKEYVWSINTLKKLFYWLKSLKNKYTWKPSDGQMDSITCAVRQMKESACYDSELVLLYQDLKKLKEE